MISNKLEEQLKTVFNGKGKITFLTGAGVSAESGIPTFRGSDGYWTIGSKNYKPHEIATYKMFQKSPYEVWKWFLYMRSVCNSAKPNAGHMALVEIEKLLGDRFTIITQNVDGLHLRAGNSIEGTFQAHGNINYMLCDKNCNLSIYPIPENFPQKSRGDDLSKAEVEMLRCPDCGGITRPFALLWDEYYNEVYYRVESCMKTAAATELLIIAGTTGSTNIPNTVAQLVLKTGGIIFDINIEKNIFSEMAINSGNGYFLQYPSGMVLPEMVKIFKECV